MLGCAAMAAGQSCKRLISTPCFSASPLPARRLDARIARALEDMRNEPSGAATAQRCAALAGLSFSRFLHVFKAEVGTPFRRLRTWKRARSLLHHVTRDAHLVPVALDTGYPDSPTSATRYGRSMA